MGKNSFYLGDVGNASKMNLILQMLAGVSIAAIAEALSLGMHEYIKFALKTSLMFDIIYHISLYSKQSWFATKRCFGSTGAYKYFVKFDA